MEERIPHKNWVLVLLLQTVASTTWSIQTPSIYQFITTPHSIPEELENEEVITLRTYMGVCSELYTCGFLAHIVLYTNVE